MLLKTARNNQFRNSLGIDILARRADLPSHRSLGPQTLPYRNISTIISLCEKISTGNALWRAHFSEP